MDKVARRKNFAANLSAAIYSNRQMVGTNWGKKYRTGETLPHLCERLGLGADGYQWLRKIARQGISHVRGARRQDLETVCKALGIDVNDLWRAPEPPPEPQVVNRYPSGIEKTFSQGWTPDNPPQAPQHRRKWLEKPQPKPQTDLIRDIGLAVLAVLRRHGFETPFDLTQTRLFAEQNRHLGVLWMAVWSELSGKVDGDFDNLIKQVASDLYDDAPYELVDYDRDIDPLAKKIAKIVLERTKQSPPSQPPEPQPIQQPEPQPIPEPQPQPIQPPPEPHQQYHVEVETEEAEARLAEIEKVKELARLVEEQEADDFFEDKDEEEYLREEEAEEDEEMFRSRGDFDQEKFDSEWN